MLAQSGIDSTERPYREIIVATATKARECAFDLHCAGCLTQLCRVLCESIPPTLGEGNGPLRGTAKSKMSNSSQNENYSTPRLRLVAVQQAGHVADAPTVTGPTDVPAAVQALIGDKDREHFVVLHLDGKHHVVSAEVVSIGTLTSSLVHPREVFKAAFLANAAAIICAHNHPSGDVKPSVEDRAVCKRLRQAGELLGVPLLDFLVVSADGSWGARDAGEL